MFLFKKIVKRCLAQYLSLETEKLHRQKLFREPADVAGPETARIEAPLSPELLPPEIIDSPHDFVFPKAFCGYLDHAFLVGRHAVPFIPQKGFIRDAVGGRGYYLHDSLTAKDMSLALKIGRDECKNSNHDYDDVCVLNHKFSHGYYHWILEALPRLLLVRNYIQANGADPKIIIPPNPQPFVTQSLNLLGFADNRLIEWDGVSRPASNLLFSSFRDYYNWLPTSVLNWLRDTLIAAAERAPESRAAASRPASPKRIYISRKNSGRRRLLNEDLLISRLKDHGFHCLTPEDVPLAQQILAFRDTEIIVAPHGAGLTNMLWTRKADIVELFGEPIIPCYYKLARQLGFEYRCVTGDSAGNDISVDCDQVLEIVSQLCGPSRQ